jgi:hypothetical protein
MVAGHAALVQAVLRGEEEGDVLELILEQAGPWIDLRSDLDWSWHGLMPGQKLCFGG